MKLTKSLIPIFVLIIVSFTVQAQTYSLKGKVFDSKTKQPLYYTVVNLKGTHIYDLTKEDGSFALDQIGEGKYIMLVSVLGYQSQEKEIDIQSSQTDLKFYLNPSSLDLDEVTVTAQVSSSKAGSTTYKIGSQAIQQVQPISIADVLQLLPGGKAGQTNLASMAQVNLRNAGEHTDLNAFGTAVIVDGNQLSNDGNMQTKGNNNTANKGIDLRNISASSIESVEVVSGIASARYGNITSGAIIVNRKAGYSPFRFSFNNTPSSYQLGANKGFKLKNGGFLNVDGDFTYSNSSPTSRKRYYQRINAGLRWTKELSKKLKWNHNMSLRYGLGFDGQRKDPDEEVVQAEFENNSHSFNLTTNGNIKVLGKLNYSINANYSRQYGYKSIVESGPSIIMESLVEGTFQTDYSPVVYTRKSESYGEPLNLNGRLETEQIFRTLGLRHNVSSGFAFSYDKNFGKGRVLDNKSNATAAGAGEREMNFYNAPASEVYSLYFQDDISLERENAHYILKLGLRYDNMLKKYNLYSPRLSFSAKYFEKYRVRLAYGISYRAPSMLQLYPGPKYFDVINLDSYSENELRRLAVVTSYIHQPTNEHLKPSKGITLEGGFDIEYKGFNFRLTGFSKEIKDGIASVSKLLTFDKQIWTTETVEGSNQLIAIPTDEIVRVSSSFSDYKNTIISKTTGIELSVQFPKIEATKTSISLSGSYLKTNEKVESLKLGSSAKLTGASLNRYALYENPSYDQYSCLSNVTIAQHVPQIKLMVTLRTETNWLTKRAVKKLPSPHPVAYYDIDGTYNDISEEDRTSDQYADLYRSFSFYKVASPPTYFNFHLQIRKETKQGHSFSFYANNFLWYNPSYNGLADVSGRRTISYLNSRISFGFGLNFKL